MEERSGGTAPSQHILDLAEGCVQYVEHALDIELDYTAETLPILDHYIDTMPDATEGGIEEEIKLLLVPCVGAYFGEVVRRVMGGVRWHEGAEDYEKYRLEFEFCYLHFNPMGVALEAFERGDQADWASHFQMLDEDRALAEAALETAGSIAEHEYYRLATRWEALQIVVSRLSERQAQKAATGAVARFGREVYSAMNDSVPPKAPRNVN